MKTLGKLKINPVKILKDNEVKSLKGGYTSWNCTASYGGTQIDNFNMSSMGNNDVYAEWECQMLLWELYPGVTCECHSI
jgi:natural product precursor